MCPKLLFFWNSPCLEFLSENAVSIPLASSMCWLVQEKLFLARKKSLLGVGFINAATSAVFESLAEVTGVMSWIGTLSWWHLRHPLQYTSTWSPERGKTTGLSHCKGRRGSWDPSNLTQIVHRLWKMAFTTDNILRKDPSSRKNPFSASSCFLIFCSGCHDSKITIYGTARNCSDNVY